MSLGKLCGGLLLFAYVTALPLVAVGQKTLSSGLGVPPPVVVPGTPTCADLNASTNPAFAHITEDWGMRVLRSPSIPFNELYTFTNGPETQLQGGAANSPLSRVRVAAGGNTLTFLSNRLISAVIVQSSLGANVYSYNPPTFGGVENGDGFNLTTPGGCATITGITFCFQSLEPTAAPASVSGTVTTADGTGIPSAKLVLTNVQTGLAVSALTNPMGYFTIENLTVGSVYTLNVSHRRHTFANDTRTFTLNEDLTDAVFIANP